MKVEDTMTMTLSFAVVPFETDGAFADIFESNSPTGMLGRKPPKPGVELLPLHRYQELRFGLLDITDEKKRLYDEMTHGAFLQLCGGDALGRYVLLQPRRALFEEIKNLFPTFAFPNNGMGPLLQHTFEIFLENVELTLQRHGSKAALLIHKPHK